MNYFYQIIILSKSKVFITNSNYQILDKQIYLTDSNTLKLDKEIINFDYLIFDDTSLIINFNNCGILHDNGLPITNFFNATSIENIFYTNNIIDTINIIENEEF